MSKWKTHHDTAEGKLCRALDLLEDYHRGMIKRGNFEDWSRRKDALLAECREEEGCPRCNDTGTKSTTLSHNSFSLWPCSCPAGVRQHGARVAAMFAPKEPTDWDAAWKQAMPGIREICKEHWDKMFAPTKEPTVRGAGG
jgi:hypothetical protein